MQIEKLHIRMKVKVHEGNENASAYGVCIVLGVDAIGHAGAENITIQDEDGGRYDGFMAKDLIEA